MGIPFIGRVGAGIYNLAVKLNNNLLIIIETPTRIVNGYNDATKVASVATGGLGVVKGTVDCIEAVSCGDGVCAAVSCIGICADTLHIFASFIPGPNVTSVVTIPVSVSCKYFVYLCKNSKYHIFFKYCPR
jgi:hypothetical protein